MQNYCHYTWWIQLEICVFCSICDIVVPIYIAHVSFVWAYVEVKILRLGTNFHWHCVTLIHSLAHCCLLGYLSLLSHSPMSLPLIQPALIYRNSESIHSLHTRIPLTLFIHTLTVLIILLKFMSCAYIYEQTYWRVLSSETLTALFPRRVYSS
jgi:hypothetical protein